VRPDAGPAKASLGTPSESQPEEPEQGAPSTTPDSPETPRLLNINTASVEALIELPGIGPSLAQRIVAYRETHGPFQTIEALIDVQGIGPNNFAEFAHLITVEE
jgi:competence protein ComEA